MKELRKLAGQQKSMLGETCSVKFGPTVSKSKTSYCYHYVHCMKYQCDVHCVEVLLCVSRTGSKVL